MFEYPSIRNRRGRAGAVSVFGSAMAGDIVCREIWHAPRNPYHPGGCVSRRQLRAAEKAEAGMEGILSWIIFGLIAGAIAKFLTPGRDPGGCIITIIIGVVGALLGGYIATWLGFGGISGFDF